MKILLINIRYGYVGGPERYLFNLKDLLEKNNHQTIPFSIHYPLNEESEYSKYFVSPLSSDNSVYFKDQKWNLQSTIKTLERNFYSTEVERNLTQLIDDTQPDFAIVLLYLRKLSPAVLVALHNKKVPFLVRLSDYGMICPSHNFFRADKICELCMNGDLINSVKYKCVQNSFGASLVNYLATKYHHQKKYFDLIQHFVTPSKFLISKMVQAGWAQEKFNHLPTFANLPDSAGFPEKESKILYAGRLERIKGIHVLLEAVKVLYSDYGLSPAVILAGDGDEDYIESLKTYCRTNSLNTVQFLGNLKKEELFDQYESSMLSVVPSLCYDNLPNSALESLALGTPVLAPNHGSFPELIVNGKNGFLFTPEDPKDLALQFQKILTSEALRKEMHQQSLDSIRSKFSPDKHYETLISIIEKILTTHTGSKNMQQK